MENTIVFCTVGTTALYAESLSVDNQDDIADLMREHASLTADLQPGWENSNKLRARVSQAHHAFWKSVLGGLVPLRNNLRRTSAEMTSTYSLCKGSKAGLNRMLRPAQDRLVFLASQNPNGRWAAEMNADLAAMYLFEGSARQDDVRTEIVPGLEGSGPDFGKVGPALKNIFDTQTIGFNDVRCNFTGGYKGIIPAITWVCGQMSQVRMFYQHEQMSEICEISLRRDALPEFTNERI